jgi:hypothetical protein
LKIKRETIYRNNNLFYSIFFVRLWSLTSIMSMGRLSLQLLADAIHIISYIFDYQVVPNGEDRGSRSTNLCLLVFSSVFFLHAQPLPRCRFEPFFPIGVVFAQVSIRIYHHDTWHYYINTDRGSVKVANKCKITSSCKSARTAARGCL